MKKLIITGNVANAEGCATTITVVGPIGFKPYQQTEEGNFNISLDVNSGFYSISILGKTDGTLVFSITGDLTKVDPNVPMNLQNNYSVPFHVWVG